MTGLDNPNLGAGLTYVDMRMVYAALNWNSRKQALKFEKWAFGLDIKLHSCW